MKYISDITVNLEQVLATDMQVLQAARVSTKGPDVLPSYDEQEAQRLIDEKELPGLINYLMKHRHGTPFEHNLFTFFVHAPIFVWREWHRHRIGFCLSGDTEVWADRVDNRNGRVVRKLNLAELHKRWRHGVQDNRGRYRQLPSVKNQTLRVLNERTHLFTQGRIENIFQSGIKELYEVRTADHRGFSVKGSKDHRILTPDGWASIEELSKTDSVYVVGKRNRAKPDIPPSLRQGIGVWTSMQRLKLIRPLDFCYSCNNSFDREELVLDHVVPVIEDIELALSVSNLRPMCLTCHRHKSNREQSLSKRDIVAGSKLVKLLGKPERVSEEMTYDITMERPHHNFVANGIVVHNSYNEESARYKKLEPVFYIPPPDRPMFKVDGWKPGKPKFLTIEQEQSRRSNDPMNQGFPLGYRTAVDDYSQLLHNLEQSYHLAYTNYEENLNMGFDPGLARDCLPVGIYSSCWVSCNARSLMAFISLRTHNPDARDVSYPLYEIEVAARKAETILQTYMPITHAAFVANGYRAP